MRTFLRANAACLALALAGCLTMAWLGLYGFAWSDYEIEAQAAVQALVAGHIGEFLRLAPAYGGSLVERAPFALVPGLWGGGALAVYRALAVPCLLAGAALGVWLVAGLRARGASRLTRGVALGLCVANPMMLRGLEIGHPEDALGGVLCVAAVLIAAHCASAERSREALLAGLLTGLAVANKEWALLALGPVLLALPARHRPLGLLGCAIGAGAILAPLLLGSSGNFVAATRASASTSSAIFQPWNVWWFLGHHGAIVHGTLGNVKPGFRTAPSWVGPLSHPAVLLAGVLVTVSLFVRAARRVALPEHQALLALSLVLLLRCLLDSWDVSYYVLPFLLALVTWEVRRPGGGLALLALAASALSWLSFVYLGDHASGDVQAASFLIWAAPLAGWLTVRLYRPRPAGARPGASGSAERHQETTVSSFGRLVSTS